ncbi:MAG: TonB-dependent receptor plug domain-containing protein [Rehaibacterium terrae]|uniref:TonB-dependent receptor plug domain-containing protein n=1 Tax=Rehaibacterium terrae TaxID=1341696 RepID=UPI00391A4AD8
MNLTNSKLRDAIRFAIVAGATGLVAAPAAFAQSDTATLDRIEVTGSRIKRAEAEGPQPVITISAEDIRAQGDVSVADVLRDASFNSFGSFQGGSGFAGGAQGGAQISLRGIGSQYTLVLINGRRMSNSPAFNGDSQNVNNIPMAAVERIEILRDGASAIYGSDAIGGVINIILKRDFEGLVVGGQISRPSDDGGDDNLFYATMGVSSDRGSMMLSYENYTRDIILAASRPGLLGPRDLSTPEGVIEAAGLGLISPTGFPGRYRRVTATGAAFGPWEAGPGCPTSFGSDPNFPRSGLVPASAFGLSGGGVVCGYNYAAIAGNTAALNRDNLTVSGEYQINDNVTAFIRSVNARTKSFGRFAPTPSTIAVFVDPTAPYNPTLGEVAPGVGHRLAVNIRFDPLGPRDSYVYDYMQDIQGGLTGMVDWFGGAEWEVAVGSSRNKQDGYGYNYVIAPLLQREVQAGLNPFDFNQVAAASSRFATTITNDNTYRDHFADARLSWDIAEIGGRAVGFVAGAEFHDIVFEARTDQQSGAGNVVGSAGATSSGARNWWAAYFETLLPVLDTLEISLAGRYDSYSDFGNEFSPKVSLAFRPNDTLLLRANYGQGFKAPNMTQLYGAPAQSFLAARDRRACFEQGIDPFTTACANVQRETFAPSNPNLGPENSTQWTVGGVWSPTDVFSISLDYYDIKIEEQIRRLTTQEVLDAEFRCVVQNNAFFCDPTKWGTVNRANVGGIIVTRPLANTAQVNTTGADLDLRYRFETGFGTFRTSFSVSKIFKYERETTPGAGLVDIIGYRGLPDLRANASVNWSWGDYSATLAGNYTDGWRDCLARNAVNDPEDALCAIQTPIPSFTTWDLSFGYNAPWNGRFSIGARNVFDRKAILQNNGAVDNLHQMGIYGRTPFVSYEQRF